MIGVIFRIDVEQTVEIGEHHSEVEVSIDRIIEEGHNMLIIIEMTLGEEILGNHKIMEVSIIELDIETIIEITILEEVKIGPGKDNIQVILAGMIKAAVVDQD